MNKLDRTITYAVNKTGNCCWCFIIASFHYRVTCSHCCGCTLSVMHWNENCWNAERGKTMRCQSFDILKKWEIKFSTLKENWTNCISKDFSPFSQTFFFTWSTQMMTVTKKAHSEFPHCVRWLWKKYHLCIATDSLCYHKPQRWQYQMLISWLSLFVSQAFPPIQHHQW